MTVFPELACGFPEKWFVRRVQCRFGHLLALGGLTFVFGCSQGPTRVEMPSYDPASSAAAAMEAYDSNEDGSLDQQELSACPSLLASLSQFDADGNSTISKDEITKRIEAWFAKKAASLSIRARILMDGRPLSGARVDLMPEDFLGNAAVPAWGMTQPSGSAQLLLDRDQAPESLDGVSGILPGLYTVKVTHPKTNIPSKYNENSELGVEIAYETTSTGVEFRLKSK